MKRNLIIDLLESYTPATKEESLHRETVITFIKQQPECFERSLAIGHVTASAWLLNKEKTHALLMHHTKLNRWLQLGGHCDGEANVLAVAVKEAQEESGVFGIEPLWHEIFDVDVHLIPANKREAEHFHYDIRFLLGVTSNEHVVQNNESKELRWISKKRDELPTNEPSITRMFEKWLQF